MFYQARIRYQTRGVSNDIRVRHEDTSHMEFVADDVADAIHAVKCWWEERNIALPVLYFKLGGVEIYEFAPQRIQEGHYISPTGQVAYEWQLRSGREFGA